MNSYSKSQVYENFLSADEFDELSDFCNKQPVTWSDQSIGIYHKDFHRTEYDVPGSVINRILKTKISQLLEDPEHQIFHCRWKEYSIPYTIHTDTRAWSIRPQFKHQTVFLMPLMEGETLKTTYFDVFLPMDNNFHTAPTNQDRLEQLKPHLRSEKNQLRLDEHDHHSDTLQSVLPYLSVDQIFTWKLKSMIRFDMQQLHCTNNFKK
jgi:hypothetical protein